MGDHLWMARFLLKRVAEEFGIVITIDPKPIKGDWNGTGLHTNVSTKEMRADGGMKAIEAVMSKLEKRNAEHIEVYGEGNRDRMTGEHETANIDRFTWGVANRGASVRVPRQCAADGKGYFEDRRPASNADPYQITGIMMETVSDPTSLLAAKQKEDLFLPCKCTENTLTIYPRCSVAWKARLSTRPRRQRASSRERESFARQSLL